MFTGADMVALHAVHMQHSPADPSNNRSPLAETGDTIALCTQNALRVMPT